ncbi:hypothetical protein RU09_15180 [Microbacterium sp. MEJ108Y]|uniref:hypothetical protein n=1 Tax=Microbacterium sp. MEJ108Y TaxID=1587523 RepID=UPI0005ACFF72|nr:hypothetical protein [Microbacterium sp. MEJ108Y]KIP88157.1 hypothetical protein RU09_15180 [Microbacterium sp. MEJ108Y]
MMTEPTRPALDVKDPERIVKEPRIWPYAAITCASAVASFGFFVAAVVASVATNQADAVSYVGFGFAVVGFAIAYASVYSQAKAAQEERIVQRRQDLRVERLLKQILAALSKQNRAEIAAAVASQVVVPTANDIAVEVAARGPQPRTRVRKLFFR